MLRSAAALAFAVLLALPAAAQVVRCTDAATGKVTYTDGTCPRGQAAREVQPRQDPHEVERERALAAEALQRKYERQQHEDRLRQEAAAKAPPTRRSAAEADPAQSVQCEREHKNLQDVMATLGRGMYDEQARLEAAQRQADLACLSPAAFARAERERASRAAQPYPPPYYGPPVVVVPPRPTPPSRQNITHCNVFRCYDRQGNTYPR